jgi:hypothetical protein
MTKSNLTFAIILSLGAVACGGVGVQTTGSLNAVHDSARGVDSLWEASVTHADAGVAGTLGRTDPSASRADLWNPAPRGSTASRGDGSDQRRPSGGVYVSDASSGIAF